MLCLSHETFERVRYELRLYFRTWKRYGIYFGVSSGRRWLNQIGTLFPAGHITLDGQWHYASEQGPEAVCVSVQSETSYYRFPHSWDVPRKRGVHNPAFLDPKHLLQEHTFPAVQNFGFKPARVIFTIEPIYQTERLSADVFMVKLDQFLSALPRSHSYAIRCCGRRYLIPPYFDILRKHDALAVLDDSVAPLLDQSQSPFITAGAGSIVLTESSDEPDWRLAIADLTRRCLHERKKLYCFVKDSADSPILHHLYALMQTMDSDLANLSIIRKQSAA